MKHFYLILTPGVSSSGPPFRSRPRFQSTKSMPERRNVTFRDRLKSTSVDADYFSLARYKAERAAIRKERNYLEFGGGLQGTLTSYNDPWISVSGGDNSIALVGDLQPAAYLQEEPLLHRNQVQVPSWVTTA